MKITLKAVVAATILAASATAAMADGAKIFVVGGKPDDPFWSIVKRGAEDAGKLVAAQGGSVTWLGPQNYDNLGVDAAELIRQAIAQHADAIVGPDWVPDAMDPAFKAVVDAKIPLIIYNAGGGKGSVLPLPATSFGSATAVAQALKGYLLQHADVDAVFAIGNVDSNSAINGIMQAGKQGKVQVCGINLDATILNNIKKGAQLCAIDQQGYMQGFLAVAILNDHVNYGLSVPTREILTGPGVIDVTNVDAALKGVKLGAR